MKRFFLLLFSMLGVSIGYSQFINNGATVVIQSGATLKVETNFINNTGGTVTNNGTLEVTGNFENNATFNSGASSLVKFSGNTAATAKSNSAVLNNVEMAKTSANVTLTDAMTINGNLAFTGTASKVVLGANNLSLSATSNVTGAGAAGYAVTNGTGAMIKGITADGTKVLEVGDMTNYTPVSNSVTGSSYASANVGGRVYTTGLQAKYAETTDFIAREWNVVATGISGYANTMTGTYVAGDVTGMSSLIKGATYHTGDWRFDGSAGAASTVTASTTNSNVKLSGKNFFGKANLRAFLQGAYSSGSMTTTLNSAGLLPLTSPYGDAPASVSGGFFAANPTIVDWVKLELRDPSAPSTPTSNKASAFIKSNGDIVGLDGTSLPRVKNGFATSVIVLSHRNHLSIRTVDAGLDVVNPTLHNFSTGLGQAYTNGTISSNDNMANLGGGVFGLYRGNSNANNTLNAADIGLVNNQANPPQSNVYNNSDLNLNGAVNSADIGIANNAANPPKSAHL